MVTTKKPIPKYDPKGKITAFQIKRIMANCQYQVDTKNEWVQWATADKNKTSLREITQEQAVKIIRAQEGSEPINQTTENWAMFDKSNAKHLKVLSLCRQANWTTNHPTYGAVADLERLSDWLKSDKCPVNKPLKKMDDTTELPKVIKALTGIVKSIYK